MAIFKKDAPKDEKKAESSEVKEKQAFHVKKKKGRRQTTKSNHTTDLSKVLLRPRITEKATYATQKKTYVFEVAVSATKKDVENAIKEYYKVTPVKVNLTKIPAKKRRIRGRREFGTGALGKKAYVFLKKDDSIEFV